MASFGQENIVVGRVVSEDDDFMVLEVAKSDDVKWTVAPLPGESNLSFYTLLFCQFQNGQPTFKKPWES